MTLKLRISLLVALFVIVGLLFASCAPAPGLSLNPSTSHAASFTVATADPALAPVPAPGAPPEPDLPLPLPPALFTPIAAPEVLDPALDPILVPATTFTCPAPYVVIVTLVGPSCVLPDLPLVCPAGLVVTLGPGSQPYCAPPTPGLTCPPGQHVVLRDTAVCELD